MMEACSLQVSLTAVCFTHKWHDTHFHLVPTLSALAKRTELVSQDVLKSIATTVNPDGVVAIAHPAWYDNLHASSLTIPNTWGKRQNPAPLLGVAVETLQDPGNLGTIIRTSAAVGVDQLWIDDSSVDPTHPKVLRASSGQWFRLPMHVVDNLFETMNVLRTSDSGNTLQIIATCPDTELSYWDIDYTLPSVFLIGNEGAGLSQSLMEMATHRVMIPLAPNVESLNAAIATALVLYEAKRQRKGL